MEFVNKTIAASAKCMLRGRKLKVHGIETELWFAFGSACVAKRTKLGDCEPARLTFLKKNRPLTQNALNAELCAEFLQDVLSETGWKPEMGEEAVLKLNGGNCQQG